MTKKRIKTIIYTLFFISALAESESESVAKYRENVEQQLESNREFHSRQMSRLRGEIEQKQKQIDTLRERNTEISSETDRLKVYIFLIYLQLQCKKSRTLIITDQRISFCKKLDVRKARNDHFNYR